MLTWRLWEAGRGIFKAKMEITRHICSDGGEEGTLIFANDENFLTRESTKGNYRQISIGENGRSDYIISDIDDFGLDGIKIHFGTFGEEAER